MQEDALLDQARTLSQLVDHEFERIETGLLALATSVSVEKAAFPEIDAELRAMSAQLGGATISLASGDGTRLLSSNWPAGRNQPPNGAGRTALGALAAGRVTISNVVRGMQEGEPFMVVAVPVFIVGQPERPAYVFTAAIPPGRLGDLLDYARSNADPGWTAAIVDRDGTVVSHCSDPVTAVGERLPAPFLARLAAEHQGFVPAGSVTRDNDTVFAFAHAPASGYSVVLGMPDAAFEAPLRAALVRAIGIGGLLLAAGLLGAFLLARRLVTSLRAVGEPASAPPLPTGLREVDDLAARLRRIADERDRVQRAVEYQLTLLRAVTESTTEAIFLTDPLGRVTYTNPEAERLTGWSQEELIGQVLHDVLQCRQPDGSTTTPSWASTLADVFRNGESKVGQEEVFFRRDGSAVDVDCSSAPVVVNGRIAGAVMIVRDITTRKRTDKTLRENEARLRDLVHTLDLAALTVHDLDGQITFWSQGCETLFGWTAEEAVGQLSHLLLATGFPTSRADMNAALERDGHWDGDLVHTCRDGRRIVVSARKVLRRDADGQPLKVTESLTDVTALRQVEADLHRLNSDLEQRVAHEVAAREAAQVRAAHAERMQALGQLAGGIAHDFNNMLQAVAGGAALIDRRPHDPVAVRRLAHIITDAAARGTSVARRMLAFAHRSDLAAESIEPADLLEGLREICVYTLGAAIRVELALPAGLPSLLADKGQLETALVNLATNARDAMPDGGLLTLAAGTEVVPPESDHSAVLSPGTYVWLSVRDTGTGMERSALARAAEPFFTTKGVGKGTGLGLSMVKGFVEQSGGGFAIESTLGVGTVVTLWLPRAIVDAGKGGQMDYEQDKIEPLVGQDAGRVLLVDDDRLVRETLAAQLEDAGYAVLPAADGSEAVSLLEQGHAVDIMITDLSMPGMSGLALIRNAQAMRPGLPAILLTGYSGDAAALAVDGAVSGSYSLISKPVPGVQLIGRVAAMMEAVAS